MFTRGFNPLNGYIPVEGSLATKDQIKNYRKKLIVKASEEINGDNPYRDGMDSARKLADTYDRRLVAFVPKDQPDKVWMKSKENISESLEEMQILCDNKTKEFHSLDVRKVLTDNPIIDDEMSS